MGLICTNLANELGHHLVDFFKKNVRFEKWVDVWRCGVFCQDRLELKRGYVDIVWLVHFLSGTKKERIDPEISGCICIQADHVVYSFKTRHSKHDFDSQIGTTRFKSSWLYFAPIQTNCALNCGINLPKWSITEYTPNHDRGFCDGMLHQHGTARELFSRLRSQTSGIGGHIQLHGTLLLQTFSSCRPWICFTRVPGGDCSTDGSMVLVY